MDCREELEENARIIRLAKREYKPARAGRDVKYNWFDCTAGFDCICGRRDFTIMEEPVTCRGCGRIYRLVSRLEVSCG